MTRRTMSETVLFGALSGMRTMGGVAALARRRGGVLQTVTGALALGEMLADKTPFVGSRIDALPLTGRAVMGAIVGGTIAHEAHANVVVGGLLGATAAVIAAHAAFRLRSHASIPNAAAGLLEDAIVFGTATMLARRVA